MTSNSAASSRGYSLNTKFILFVLVIELFVICGGLYINYTFLVAQRAAEIRVSLSSQVEMLAKEIELQKDRLPNFSFTGKDLDPHVFFQVLTTNGEVIWDSKHPEHLHLQARNTHPLLQELSASGGVSAPVKNHFTFALDDHDHYLGFYRKAIDHYLALGAVSKEEVQHEIFLVMEKFLVLATFFCGVSLLLIVFLTNQILKPIRELTSAAEKISDGEFDFALAPPSRDEIGKLSSAFDSMAKRVRELLKEEVQKVRIKQEVSSVAHIQQSLLPAEEIVEPRFEIQSFYQSATETGGDYWGYFETEKQLVIYIADATGHGLSSAMLTAAARGCFSAMHLMLSQSPERLISPSELLRYANEAVVDSAQDELNMTMFVACLELDASTLSYSSAGHNPALVLRDQSIDVLRSLGPRLGESKDFPITPDKKISFSANDILLLYTDGLTDCLNHSNEAFGKDRVRDILKAAQSANQLELKEIKMSLVDAVTGFTGDKPLMDDITLAFMKLRNVRTDT